ncbi:MAG: hypothetical protein OEQ53_02190 [Saprospiraceae bacterium]|nr:hypothetical protein [Saprospiraceae bacterium]
MQVIRHIFFFTILCTYLAACQDDDSIDFIPVYDVPEDYQEIVDLFVDEAAVRGIELTIDNLIVLEDPDLPFDLCGSCNASDLNIKVQRIVSIHPRRCWPNNLQKEALLFHELGHCILGRSHTSALLPNGDFKSLMVPSNIGVYSPCVYQFGGAADDCNFTFKRTYYIDELFDPDMPIPDWAR